MVFVIHISILPIVILLIIFFKAHFSASLHVPIVIIQSSIRGAPVETWTSRGYLEKTGDFSKQIAVLNTLTSTSRDWFVYKDYTNWMSIPQSDLDKNSKLIQNPGY